MTLRAYEFADGARTVVTVPGLTGETAAEFELVRDGRILTATRLHGSASWRMQVADNGQSAVSVAADVDRCSIEL